MTVSDYLGTALAIIQATGPIGAAIAAGIVGLALAVIVYASAKGLFRDDKAGDQAVQFQAKLLEAVRLLTERETALQRDNEGLRRQLAELAVSVDLCRIQLRRAYEILRDVKEGRIAPGAIMPGELAGSPS